jgi:hypothetical protein
MLLQKTHICDFAMDRFASSESSGRGACIQQASECDRIQEETLASHLLVASQRIQTSALLGISGDEGIPGDQSPHPELIVHLLSLGKGTTFGIHADQGAPQIRVSLQRASPQDL